MLVTFLSFLDLVQAKSKSSSLWYWSSGTHNSKTGSSTLFSCFQYMFQRKTCDMHSWFLATAHFRTSTYFSCVCDVHATAMGFASSLKLAPSFNMQTSTSSATCKAQLQTPKQYPKLKTTFNTSFNIKVSVSSQQASHPISFTC